MVCVLGRSLGHCREPLGSPRPGQHSCADPGLLPAWWEPRGCVGSLAPACTCSFSPSLGSASADLASFPWPPAPGLSLPLSTGSPDVLMNLPDGSGPSLCSDLRGPWSSRQLWAGVDFLGQSQGVPLTSQPTEWRLLWRGARWRAALPSCSPSSHSWQNPSPLPDRPGPRHTQETLSHSFPEAPFPTPEFHPS